MTLALATLSAAREASALELVRLSRHGYVLVDEAGAETPYNGRVPVQSTTDTLAFVAEVTRLIADIPDAPRARFVAVMQSRRDFSVAQAFYMPIKNTVRGIGQRQGGRETWDLNDTAGTSFPLLGFVWLNSWEFYTSVGAEQRSAEICTQEFGHRWGPQVLIPPFPTGEGIAVMDAGADASSGDASADGESDASADASADASGPTPIALAPTALLGRDRVHWSYFFSTGGSPLEGNSWNEVSPGVFRVASPTYRFSTLDLYMMGVLAPEEVTPSFLIAEPDLGAVRDAFGNPITPATGPEGGEREVEIRGRRVDVGIADIIRANGLRNPRAVTIPPTMDTDGGALPDASTAIPREPRENDIDVIWVMLTTRDRMREFDVFDFDRAVDSCAGAYVYASQGRSAIVPLRMPSVAQDAGAEAGDAARDAGAAASDAGTSDGAIGAEGNLGGGCACRAGGVSRERDGALWWAALAGGLAWARRRRARERCTRARTALLYAPHCGR